MTDTMYRKKLKILDTFEDIGLTIPEIEAIAELATEIIKKEFEEVKFKNPPLVSPGIVRAVLQAAKQERLQ